MGIETPGEYSVRSMRAVVNDKLWRRLYPPSGEVIRLWVCAANEWEWLREASGTTTSAAESPRVSFARTAGLTLPGTSLQPESFRPAWPPERGTSPRGGIPLLLFLSLREGSSTVLARQRRPPAPDSLLLGIIYFR